MSVRVLSVFGTRPEAIKMAPVVHQLQDNIDTESIVCVTGQHREMLDQVLSVFEIAPVFDLDIMAPGQDLADVSARVLRGVRDVIRDVQPDVVLVQGDTTTCLAAAMAAFYQQVPIGHVEAGLRTGDLTAPFPEEANRTLVGRLAQWHFAPTTGAAQNLYRENVAPTQVHVTGNTVIDALLWVRSRLPVKIMAQGGLPLPHAITESLQDPARRSILVTGHRRENFGDGFRNICRALRDLATQHSDWTFIFPVHLNPNVQKPVQEILAGLANIHLIAPLDYVPFVWLMDNVDLIITDSGGIQEEAPSLGKPVLLMRDVTERPESIVAGTVRLVGTNYARICNAVEEVLGDREVYLSMSRARNPYGDGQAAQRIADVIKRVRGESPNAVSNGARSYA